METKEKKNKANRSQEDPLKKHGNNIDSTAKAEENQIKNQKSENENKNTDDTKLQKDFWEEAKGNISEGAKLVGETVSEYAQTIGEKAKETFKTGSEVTMEMVHYAQDIIDSYKHKQEIKELSEKRDEVFIELGRNLYRKVKGIENDLNEEFLQEKDVQSMLNEIENIDRKIIEINEQEKESK
jgi:hypothetical protein